MIVDPFFHRPKLAEKLTQALLQLGALNSMASGLFLAAPRRTGKSTFLREDLRPMLMDKGVIVIYADLWKNKEVDPGIVIANAITEEMLKHKGVIARLAKSTGVDKVSVAGMSFTVDRDKIGVGQGASLSTVLAELSDETKKMIVLIIDEAQHAITTNSGSDTLFALKAARDELNSSLHHGLRIVATGSNRDKISMLRGSKDQAFFSAPLLDFPPLGKEYIQWFCANSNLNLEPEKVFDLFKQASSRPEILNTAVGAMALDLSEDELGQSKTFEQLVLAEITRSNNELLRVIESLTPLQSAVIRVLAFKGERYAPFDAETVRLYALLLTKIAPGQDIKVDVSSVQQALTMLQEKALVWRAARGVYALEESALGDLLQRQGYLAFVNDESTESNAVIDRPAG